MDEATGAPKAQGLQERAAEYRANARAEPGALQASTLTQAKEKHRAAAQRWLLLAEQMGRRRPA